MDLSSQEKAKAAAAETLRFLDGPYEPLHSWDTGFDAYPGYVSAYVPKRVHERLLLEALYLFWYKEDAKGYQTLADCYNLYGRKADERPLLPPPSYL